MPVKRRIAKVRRPELSDVEWAILNDAKIPVVKRGDDADWEKFVLMRGGLKREPVGFYGHRTLFGLWSEYRDETLSAWILDYPGTRPSLWWTFDAPRLQLDRLGGRGAAVQGDRWPEPRKRLGGIGTPLHEVFASEMGFRYGLPTRWVSASEAAYSNGRAVDASGNRLASQCRPDDFRGVPPDVDHPPTYESQAAYLQRHDLFMPGEKGRLPADAFEPVAMDAATLRSGV